MSAPVAGMEAGKSGMDAGRGTSESVRGRTGGGKSGFSDFAQGAGYAVPIRRISANPDAGCGGRTEPRLSAILDGQEACARRNSP